MKIAILGTRGIPNQYGGFEQFAEYLAKGLTQKGHDVFVYSPHNHSYQINKWNDINIIHCYDPEFKIGTAGQFVYDLNCILDSRKRNFDLILQLGYTSSSVWGWLFSSNAIVLSNMDGLEWKRTKYKTLVQQFLKFAEKLAVKYSQYWVADSIGIQDYLKEKYRIDSDYIPYGADLFDNPDDKVLEKYHLEKQHYDLLIARMEPENNIETILEGWLLSATRRKIIVVGNSDNNLGKYLKAKFKNEDIVFAGGIYNIVELNNLRHFCAIYFHGHTVGGTNPSLLEAMAAGSFICAHDNVFNKTILNNDAEYFQSAKDIAVTMDKAFDDNLRKSRIENNREKVRTLYSWNSVINKYEGLMQKLVINRQQLSK